MSKLLLIFSDSPIGALLHNNTPSATLGFLRSQTWSLGIWSRYGFVRSHEEMERRIVMEL